MNEDKNTFDLWEQMRETSETLQETPSLEVWERLDARLEPVRRERPPRRKPFFISNVLISAIVFILLTICVAIWLVTRQHAALLRGERQFTELQFLNGQWTTAKDQKAYSMFECRVAPNTQDTLRAFKTAYFQDSPISWLQMEFQHRKEHVYLIFDKQVFDLKTKTNENKFVFKNKNKPYNSIELEQLNNQQFLLHFVGGAKFYFSKVP